MENILERYERYSYAERQLVANDPDSSANWSLEYSKLKSRIEILQRNQRHYMGEDLNSLSLKELQNLEQQLDTALKHIRSKKNQLMYESISELQKKERAIHDQNSMLAKKIKEKEKAMTQQAQWEQQNPDAVNTTSFLITQTFPGLYNSGPYHGEASDGPRRNELELSLDQPIFNPCHLGCFAA
ncbi:Floral homeotic protein APETALA 1 [Heracleum sosnowskyi]|uniref:Floral homeotic protein APETALA 1 n=1 Tax=Heracleum sosnowskyi TaxID=360622 RepID=A0AAD8I9N9_9APIA|nr:Floral homeotic protein APETALA 1 [Heracleum sosnowskyi]